MKRTENAILPVNKTIVYYSPCENDDILVRTGTIADNSCFFHSLLHAYSRDYVSRDKKGRTELVTRLRKTLENTITAKQWEDISSSMVVKIPFQEVVQKLISDLYRYVLQNKKGKTRHGRTIIRKVVKTENDSKTYSIIFEMVSQKELEKIIGSVYNNSGDLPLSKVKDIILQEVKKYYKTLIENMGQKYKNNKQLKFCLEKLITMMFIILDEADEYARNEYVTSIKDTNGSIDNQTLEMMSNHLNRDIYILDSDTGLPLDNHSKEYIKKRKSIILLWLEKQHYEVVGKLVSEHTVQRQFSSKDPLITKLKTLICDPNAVFDKYPEIAPYLTKETRKKYKNTRKDSEEQRSRESKEKERSEQYESDEHYEPSSSIEKSESGSDDESDYSESEEEYEPKPKHKTYKYRKSKRKRRVK